MLIRDLNMDDEELLAAVFKGIPEEILRLQARLQCFDDPEKMLRAFANILLQQHGGFGGKGGAQSAATNISAVLNCNY